MSFSGIMVLVIVQVFVAEGKTVNPLREHLSDRMLHQGLIPAVVETFCKTRYQIQPLAGLTQQERPAIRTGFHPRNGPQSREFQSFKAELDWLHSVTAKAVLLFALTAVWKLS